MKLSKFFGLPSDSQNNLILQWTTDTYANDFHLYLWDTSSNYNELVLVIYIYKSSRPKSIEFEAIKTNNVERKFWIWDLRDDSHCTYVT